MEAWCRRDIRPERKIWDSVLDKTTGHRNHILWQQWRSWGKVSWIRLISKAQFSTRKKVHLSLPEKKNLKGKCWNCRRSSYYFSLYSSVFSFYFFLKRAVSSFNSYLLSDYNFQPFPEWWIYIFHYLKIFFNRRCSRYYCLVLQIRKHWQHQERNWLACTASETHPGAPKERQQKKRFGLQPNSLNHSSSTRWGHSINTAINVCLIIYLPLPYYK